MKIILSLPKNAVLLAMMLFFSFFEIINAQCVVTLNLTAGSATQTVCAGTTLTNIIYTWGGSSTGIKVTGLPTGLTSTVNTVAKTMTINGTPTTTGTYTVSTTGQVAPCTAKSLSGTITVNPKPYISSLPNGTICSGVAQNYQITSSVTAIYNWTRIAVDGISNTSKSGSSASITETLVNTLRSPVNVYYTITPTGTLGGCVGSSFTYMVTVNALPNNTSTGTPGFVGNTICLGNNGSITYDALNASFVTPYTIAYTDGISVWKQVIEAASPTVFNVPVSPTITTTYTLTSITNGNGCITTNNFQDPTARVTVKATPPPDITVIQPDCKSRKGTITVATLDAGNQYSFDDGLSFQSSPSKSDLFPNDYNIIVKNVSGCNSLPAICHLAVPSVTWTGTSWTPNAPSLKDEIIFNGDYSSTADLSACSCTINSGNVTINAGHTLTIENNINATRGLLTVEDDASLIQIAQSVNTGNITVKRNSASVPMNDYTYWSSPITGAQTLQQFSPNSNPKYFLTYDNNWSYVNASTKTFTPGIGYAILAPLDANGAAKDFQFNGVPNNGNINLPISLNAPSPSYKLIGNPYPSALDADKFINTNKSISGSLYFWSHLNSSGDTLGDYAVYNLTGGTATAPNRWISSCQGFIVEIVDNGNITFTNDMRIRDVGYDNSNFCRPGDETTHETILDKNRIWLNLTNNKSCFSQILIAFVEKASNAYDPGFDGPRIEGDSTALYSLIEDKPFTIQARAMPFNDSDVVPLGYKAIQSGEFKISIENVDGLFSGNQTVFLEDRLLNKIQNLKTSSYIFTTDIGIFNSRFNLRFKDLQPRIETPKMVPNDVIISSKDQQIIIKSTTVEIDKVLVFDFFGRIIFKSSEINNKETLISNLTPGILIVKTILSNGHSITKKLVNR